MRYKSKNRGMKEDGKNLIFKGSVEISDSTWVRSSIAVHQTAESRQTSHSLKELGKMIILMQRFLDYS